VIVIASKCQALGYERHHEGKFFVVSWSVDHHLSAVVTVRVDLSPPGHAQLKNSLLGKTEMKARVLNAVQMHRLEAVVRRE